MCSYHFVHRLFTQSACLMRNRYSMTVLVTYVVLFCFLFFERLFNRSLFTNMKIYMYVTCILKMAISDVESKSTLLTKSIATLHTEWLKQRVCFSQISNCHQCFVIKTFLSTNRFWRKRFETPGWCSFQLTYSHFTTKQYWLYWWILSSNNPSSSNYDCENFVSLIQSTD